MIVISVPRDGPAGVAGADAAVAAQLALEDAGSAAELRALDAGPRHEGPRAVENARAALADAGVVAYLGEFFSAASLLALPLLEAGGLPQVSFANTYRGLAGVSFFNVMPHDEALAADIVAWMIELGVERPVLLNWDGEYGLDMRLLVHRAWASAGRRVAGATGFRFGPDPKEILDGADAVFLGAVAGTEAAGALHEIHAVAPDALLFGMDGLNDAAFVGGLPDPVRERLRVGTAALRGDRLPEAGHAVMRRLADRVGHPPDTHAVYAYEAMRLVLDALQAAGPDRAAITEHLRATRDRESVLGRYGFDALGATTLGRGGRLVPD